MAVEKNIFENQEFIVADAQNITDFEWYTFEGAKQWLKDFWEENWDEDEEDDEDDEVEFIDGVEVIKNTLENLLKEIDGKNTIDGLNENLQGIGYFMYENESDHTDELRAEAEAELDSISGHDYAQDQERFDRGY